MNLQSQRRGSCADRVLASFERIVRLSGRQVRKAFWPGLVRQPLYRGPLTDDLLFGQPVNTVMRLVHRWGRSRPVAAEGASVVVVNWNTLDVLKVTMEALRCFSPPSTEIIIVDNGSTDGSREWLKTRPFSSRVALLPANIGHGRGLDVGVAMSRRPIVITLDSDAFPYSGRWLDTLLEPILSHGKLAAGMWGRRDRVHPACAAFTRTSYYDSGLSLMGYIPYVDRGEEPRLGVNAWDTAEMFFNSLGSDATTIFPADETDFEGCTMGGVVYHHYNSTTLRMGDTDAEYLGTHQSSWSRAVETLLGQPPLS